MDRQLAESLVEYVELADELITKAAEKKSFSEEYLEKAASSLLRAGVIQNEEKSQLTKLFKQDPDTALESLCKVAEMIPKKAYDTSLGAPARDKVYSDARRESDRIFEERFLK